METIREIIMDSYLHDTLQHQIAKVAVDPELYASAQTALAELSAEVHLYWMTYARLSVMIEGTGDRIQAVVNSVGENLDFYEAILFRVGRVTMFEGLTDEMQTQISTLTDHPIWE
eukprot:3544206-Rhodomonas_salina.2